MLVCVVCVCVCVCVMYIMKQASKHTNLLPVSCIQKTHWTMIYAHTEATYSLTIIDNTHYTLLYVEHKMYSTIIIPVNML